MQAFDYIEAKDVDGADDEGGGDVGWFGSHLFHSIGHAVSKAVHGVEHGVSSAVHSVEKVAQKGLRSITNNPLWKIVETGVSFIPGVGTAVSAGMASAAAIGRGESLKDIGLAAAKGALPGGPVVSAAFDMAIGAIQGHNLAAEALKEVRAQIPGGDLAKGAFDAAVMIASKATPAAIAALHARLPPAAQQSFRAALGAHAAHAAGQKVVSHPATVRAIPGRTVVKHFPIMVRPPNPAKPFPQHSVAINKAATVLMASPHMRAAPAASLAKTAAVQSRDGRDAIAAFLQRFGAARELDYRDVGEMETFDQAARRHNVVAPDLGEWPSEDTGAIHTMAFPPMSINRKTLHGVYRRGDATLRKALLAHELLAHVARNTGELEGTQWVIQGNGDWPAFVAGSVVGDQSRWKEILPFNPSFKLQTNGNIPQWTKGTRVQLPPSWVPSAIPVPAATISIPSGEATSSGGPPFASAYPLGYPSSVYMIKKGDDGEAIAKLITGDINRWRELLVTNPGNADPKYGIAVYEGKTLKLPANWVQAQATAPIVLATQPPIALPAPSITIGPSPQPSAPPSSGGGFGSPPAVPPFTLPSAPIASLPTTPVDTTPVVTGSATQIGATEVMLAAFYREHPEATWGLPAQPFGSTPDDLAGVWNQRSAAAMLGFQTWWNQKGHTPALVLDGLPDAASLKALQAVTDADNGTSSSATGPSPSVTGPSPSAKKSSSSGGGLAIPIGLLLAALGAS